jgi:copper chaperone
MTTHTIPVEGMTCGHCEGSVRDALARLADVTVLSVDREAAEAKVEAADTVSRQQLASVIEDIGFDVKAGWTD